MKRKIEDLYVLAEEYGIPIMDNCPDSVVSMSIKLEGGQKIIALSKFESEPEKPQELKKPYTKLECFSHEMGHCMTDSFYRGYSPLEHRAKHEYRANKWAINYLIPFSDLCTAVSDGNRELWQLAEYFDVSPDFVEKAITYHENHGNVVPRELYLTE